MRSPSRLSLQQLEPRQLMAADLAVTNISDDAAAALQSVLIADGWSDDDAVVIESLTTQTDTPLTELPSDQAAIDAAFASVGSIKTTTQSDLGSLSIVVSEGQAAKDEYVAARQEHDASWQTVSDIFSDYYEKYAAYRSGDLTLDEWRVEYSKLVTDFWTAYPAYQAGRARLQTATQGWDAYEDSHDDNVERQSELTQRLDDIAIAETALLDHDQQLAALEPSFTEAAVASFDQEFETVELPEHVYRTFEVEDGRLELDLPTDSAITIAGNMTRGSNQLYAMSVQYGAVEGDSNGFTFATGSRDLYIHHRVDGTNVRNERRPLNLNMPLQIKLTPEGTVTGFTVDRGRSIGFGFSASNPIDESVLLIEQHKGQPFSGRVTYSPNDLSSRTDVLSASLDAFDNELEALTNATGATIAAYDRYMEYQGFAERADAMRTQLLDDIEQAPAYAQGSLTEHYQSYLDRLENLSTTALAACEPLMSDIYAETMERQLHIVAVDGPTVTFHVMSDSDMSTVALTPVGAAPGANTINGIISERDFYHEGGSEHFVGVVAGHPGRQSGSFVLTLSNRDGVVLDSFQINASGGNFQVPEERRWNSSRYVASRELLATDEAFEMLGKDERVEEMDSDLFMVAENVMMEAHDRGMLVAGQIPGLAAPQRTLNERLLNESGLRVSETDRNAALQRAYPELFDAALMELIYEEEIASRPTYSRGNSIENVNDRYRRYVNDFNDSWLNFNLHIENTIIPSTVAVVQMAANGEDVTEAYRDLTNAVNHLGFVRPVADEAFPIPAMSDIVVLGSSLYFGQTDLFRASLDKEQDILKRMANAETRAEHNGVVNEELVAGDYDEIERESGYLNSFLAGSATRYALEYGPDAGEVESELSAFGSYDRQRQIGELKDLYNEIESDYVRTIAKLNDLRDQVFRHNNVVVTSVDLLNVAAQGFFPVLFKPEWHSKAIAFVAGTAKVIGTSASESVSFEDKDYLGLDMNPNWTDRDFVIAIGGQIAGSMSPSFWALATHNLVTDEPLGHIQIDAMIQETTLNTERLLLAIRESIYRLQTN